MGFCFWCGVCDGLCLLFCMGFGNCGGFLGCGVCWISMYWIHFCFYCWCRSVGCCFGICWFPGGVCVLSCLVCISLVVFWFFRVHVLRVFWSAVCHSFSLGFYIVCVLVFFVVFYPVFSLCSSLVCGGVFFLVIRYGVFGGILPGVSSLVFSLIFFQVLFQGSWGSVRCVVLPGGVCPEFWARCLLGRLCGGTCIGFLCCTFPSWKIGRWCCRWSWWGLPGVFFLGGVFGFPLWWCYWFLILLFSCLLSFLWW